MHFDTIGFDTGVNGVSSSFLQPTINVAAAKAMVKAIRSMRMSVFP